MSTVAGGLGVSSGGGVDGPLGMVGGPYGVGPVGVVGGLGGSYGGGADGPLGLVGGP